MANKLVKKGEDFTCELCGEEFNALLPEDFAQAEYEALFEEPLGASDYVTVCGDCFEKVTGPGPYGTQVLLRDA